MGALMPLIYGQIRIELVLDQLPNQRTDNLQISKWYAVKLCFEAWSWHSQPDYGCGFIRKIQPHSSALKLAAKWLILHILLQWGCGVLFCAVSPWLFVQMPVCEQAYLISFLKIKHYYTSLVTSRVETAQCLQHYTLPVVRGDSCSFIMHSEASFLHSGDFWPQPTFEELSHSRCLSVRIWRFYVFVTMIFLPRH